MHNMRNHRGAVLGFLAGAGVGAGVLALTTPQSGRRNRLALRRAATVIKTSGRKWLLHSSGQFPLAARLSRSR